MRASMAASASRRDSLQPRSAAVRSGMVILSPSISNQSHGHRSRVPPLHSGLSVGSCPRSTYDSRGGVRSSSPYRNASQPRSHAAVRSQTTACSEMTSLAARALRSGESGASAETKTPLRSRRTSPESSAASRSRRENPAACACARVNGSAGNTSGGCMQATVTARAGSSAGSDRDCGSRRQGHLLWTIPGPRFRHQATESAQIAQLNGALGPTQRVGKQGKSLR